MVRPPGGAHQAEPTGCRVPLRPRGKTLISWSSRIRNDCKHLGDSLSAHICKTIKIEQSHPMPLKRVLSLNLNDKGIEDFPLGRYSCCKAVVSLPSYSCSAGKIPSSLDRVLREAFQLRPQNLSMVTR